MVPSKPLDQSLFVPLNQGVPKGPVPAELGWESRSVGFEVQHCPSAAVGLHRDTLLSDLDVPCLGKEPVGCDGPLTCCGVV